MYEMNYENEWNKLWYYECNELWIGMQWIMNMNEMNYEYEWNEIWI